MKFKYNTKILNLVHWTELPLNRRVGIAPVTIEWFNHQGPYTYNTVTRTHEEILFYRNGGTGGTFTKPATARDEYNLSQIPLLEVLE